MATTKAIIDVSINTGDASAQLRNLQTQINAFNATLNKTTAAHSLAARQFAKEIITYTNASQAFTAEQVRMETAARRLDQTLTKGRGSLGQYFSAKFNKNGAEAAAVLSLANARAQALETQFVKLTSAAGGFRDAIAIRPLQALNDSMEVANQKAAIHSAMFRQATTSMINFGKNTQWAGRQLMVGFTVPMTIFGAAAGKTFKEIEQAAVRFKKVYGDAFTTPAEIEKNMKAVEGLALEFTKYGIAVKDTIGLAAEAAAAGAQNADLIAATTEATRLATLGQMEQQEALTATIALQNAFKLSAQDLSKEVNFLNMVENQTVVTLQDLAGAIPRVAPVIVGLGGDVRDMAAMLAAMQEGGVSAAQGANALKSGLGSLINPTEKASKVLAEMGVNINSIVQANRGDLMGTVTAFAQALSGLDKFTRQQALEELFGKYQYARLGALFENIIKDGTQASRVLQIAGLSAEQMAKSAEKELSVISEATSTKYMAAMERFKLAIAPVGEMFMKISTPIINFFAKLFEMFDKLPDGAKTFTAFAAIIVGVVVPAGTMFLGLLMNLIGTLAKFGHIIGVAFKGFAKGGIGGAIQSVSQSLRYMGLEEINAAQAAQQLGQSTEFANAALLDQVAAAGNARLAIDRLTQAYDLLIDKQLQVSARSGTVFGAGAAAGQAAASSGATRVQRRNRGGKIAYMSGGGSTVPGFGNTDTVPAMLTPGEFVVNKKATQENLSLLHAINNGKRVGGFNKGGRIPGVQYLQNAGRVKTLQELIADNYRAEIELGGTTSTQSGNLGFGLPSSTRTLDTLSPAELSLFNSMMRGPLASRGIDDSLIRLFGLGIVPTAKEINDKLRLGTLPGSDASRVFSNPDIWEPMTRTSAGLLLPTSGRSFAESIARQIGSTLLSRETVSDDDIYDEVERAMKANGGAAFYDELQRDPGALRLGLPELLSRHLKSTNPQGSVGSIYEPVLSQVATGVRQVGPYKGRPGVIGNFGSLGWLLLGPGKTLTVSGRSGRSYENEREFDFSRLMPGMVRTHALRPLAANNGGLIPGVKKLIEQISINRNKVGSVAVPISPGSTSYSPRTVFETGAIPYERWSRPTRRKSSTGSGFDDLLKMGYITQEQYEDLVAEHTRTREKKSARVASHTISEDFIDRMSESGIKKPEGGKSSYPETSIEKALEALELTVPEMGQSVRSRGRARVKPSSLVSTTQEFNRRLTDGSATADDLGTLEYYHMFSFADELMKRGVPKDLAIPILRAAAAKLKIKVKEAGKVDESTFANLVATSENESLMDYSTQLEKAIEKGTVKVNKGGLIPGIQYFANAGIVKRLMNSSLDRGQLQRKLVSDNQWDDLDDDLKRQVIEWDAAGNTGFGIFGAAARAKQQPSKKAEKKSGAYSPLKTIAMTDIDFGDVSGLLRLMRGGEFDEADQAFLIDYIKEGLDYGRLKDFHPQARQYHGEYYDTAMSSLVTEAQRIGNPKLIEALVRLTGIQAKNSGGLIPGVQYFGTQMPGRVVKKVGEQLSLFGSSTPIVAKSKKDELNDIVEHFSTTVMKGGSKVQLHTFLKRWGKGGEAVLQYIKMNPAFFQHNPRGVDPDAPFRSGPQGELFGVTRFSGTGLHSFAATESGLIDDLISYVMKQENIPYFKYDPGPSGTSAGGLRLVDRLLNEGIIKDSLARDLASRNVNKLTREDALMMIENARKIGLLPETRQIITNKNSGGLIPGGMVTPSKNFYGKFNSETVKLFTKWISSQPSQIASMKSGIGEDAGLAKTFAGGFRRSSRAEILERATWLSQMGVPKPGDTMSLGALASFSPKGRGVKQHLSDSQLTKDAESAAYWLSLDQRKQKEDAKILRRIMEVGPENWPSWAPERRYFSPTTRETGLDAYIRDTRAAIEQRKSSIKESKAKIRSFNQMIPTIIELETPKGTIRANLDDIVALQDQQYMGNQTSEQERILHNALIQVLDVREESDGIRRVVAKLISSQIPGYNKGAVIPRFANGGDVGAAKAFATRPIFESAKKTFVPGTGNTDTVPAMLTPGEFVINKQATMQNLPLLHAINSGSAIRANKGGFIGVQYLQDGGMFSGMNNMLNLGEVGPTSPLPVNISEVDGQDPARTAMGQDARRQNGMGMGKRFAISSGVGAIAGSLSMAPLIPGIGQNEQLAGILGQSGMALGALSMLTMLPTPIALLTAAIGGLTGAFIYGKSKLDEMTEKAVEAGASIGGMSNSIKIIEQATGLRTLTAEDKLFRFNQEEIKTISEFQPFFESDTGQKFVNDLKAVTSEERFQKVSYLIAQGIGSGLEPEKAQAFGKAIALATGDAMLASSIASEFAKGVYKSGVQALIDLEKERQKQAPTPTYTANDVSDIANMFGGRTRAIGAGTSAYGTANVGERSPLLESLNALFGGSDTVTKNLQQAYTQLGFSIQTVQNLSNAEAVLDDQRNQGLITQDEYERQLAQINDLQNKNTDSLSRTFEILGPLAPNIKKGLESYLKTAGFDDQQITNLVDQIAPEDIAQKIFKQGYNNLSKEQQRYVDEVFTKTISGITPENMQQRLVDIQTTWTNIASDAIDAIKNGMSASDVFNKQELSDWIQSRFGGSLPPPRRGSRGGAGPAAENLLTAESQLNALGVSLPQIQNVLNAFADDTLATDILANVDNIIKLGKALSVLKDYEQINIELFIKDPEFDPAQLKAQLDAISKFKIPKDVKDAFSGLALPSASEFANIARGMGVAVGDIFASYRDSVSEVGKAINALPGETKDAFTKAGNIKPKFKVNILTSLLGGLVENPADIANKINSAMPELNPLQLMIMVAMGGPGAALLLADPNFKKAVEKGENVTFNAYGGAGLEKRSTNYSPEDIALGQAIFGMQGAARSGADSSAGGGGGTKSISQQLSERLEQVKKLYSGLTNVINAKEMKKFIAGPFAAEFLQYLSEQGEEGINIISKNRKRLIEEYNKYKQIKLTEILNASLIAPLARLEEFRTRRRESRFTGNLISQGLNEEQIDFVREQVGQEAISEYMRLSNKENKTKKDIKDLAVYQKNIDDAIAKSKEFSKISLQESIRNTGLEFKETNKNLDKTLELMASGITPEFANELMQIDRASEMSAEQLKQFGSQILETKTKMEIAKGVLVNLSEEFDLMGQIASTQIEKINKLEIAPIEKEIDGLNKSISNLEKSKKPQQDAINSLREQEQELQKVYEERVKALDEVQKANERIAAQQRGQMDVASALSRGDIAGAAQAALELQRTMAQQRVEDTRNAMQQQNESEREAIAEKIKVHENSIKSIDEQIVSLQDQIALKQGDIEKAKERQLALEEKIYAIQLMRDMIETKRAQQEAALVSGREADAKLLGDQFDLQRSILAGLSYMKTDEGKAQLSQFNQALGQGQALGTPGMSASATTITNAAQLISGTMPLVSDAVTKLIDPKTGIPKNLEDTQSAIATLAKTLGTSAESLQNFVKIAQEFLNTVKLNAIKEIQGATSAAIGQINAAKSEASKSTDTGKTPKTPYFGGFIYRAFGGMIGYRGSREPAPGMMYGGKVRKFGFGSFVPGVGNTDKVPALLTPGEFVVRKSVAQAYRSQLESLNNQVNPQAGSQVYPGVPTKYRSNGIDSLVSIGNLSSFNPFTDLSNVDTSIVDLSRVNANTFPVITNVSSDSYPFDANYSNSQNVLNTFSPVQYTYNVSVNAETGADPDEIARAIVTRINTRDRRNIRGTKING